MCCVFKVWTPQDNNWIAFDFLVLVETEDLINDYSPSNYLTTQQNDFHFFEVSFLICEIITGSPVKQEHCNIYHSVMPHEDVEITVLLILGNRHK